MPQAAALGGVLGEQGEFGLDDIGEGVSTGHGDTTTWAGGFAGLLG